jgi:fructose-1,6-bisphosphatase/inositol monophosphatase family enzyme
VCSFFYSEEKELNMEHYDNLSTQEVYHRYEFMEAAARTLGDHAVNLAQGELTMRLKEDGSKVTNVDEDLNQLLIDMTHHYFPHDLVWGEEGSNSEKGDLEAAAHHWLWIADPIDGTNKLWRSYIGKSFDECNSTVLLSGFAPGMTTPLMSAVYSPFRPEQTLAMAGPYGAYAATNYHMPWPLTLYSGATNVDDVTKYEYSRWGQGLEQLPEVLSAGARIKTPVRMASVALQLVDVSAFPLEAHPHDVISGAHIARMAGADVRSLTGRPFEEIDWRVDPVDGVIATPTPELTNAILQRL